MWIFSGTDFVFPPASTVPGTLLQVARSYGILEITDEQEVAFLETKATNSKAIVEHFLNIYSPSSMSLKIQGEIAKTSQKTMGIWHHMLWIYFLISIL